MLSIVLIRAQCFFAIAVLIFSCKTSGPGIFAKKSPHEQYGEKITDAGLHVTALGSSWFRIAQQSLSSPLNITLPYKESGYFSADRPSAAGLRFDALRGQKLLVTIDKKPVTNFTLYIDLWKALTGSQPKYVAAADTSTYSIQHEVDESGTYILRVQPELLSSGEYTISITVGPSLAYPIKAPGNNHTKSFWGADRDGGARRHEGIDMFAARRTPVVAAANGRVTRVHETPIGGKVVWLKAENSNYTLYYAHLDSQIVKDGDRVQIGDTLGLMGNTGNARTTSPHLHFGVYTFSGPVDPYPFVNPNQQQADKIIAPLKMLGKLARTSASTKLFTDLKPNSTSYSEIEPNTLFQIEAASTSWYKMVLPDGRQGYILYAAVDVVEKPLRRLAVKENVSVFDRPDSLAAKKTSIPSGEPVDILADFNDYYFITTRDKINGWITK